MSKCILCKSDEINNLELGEMKVLGDIRVHYFCMLLSSGLLTNGAEDEGILGFMPEDIKKESKRALRLKCHYCHRIGASIGCCIAACSRSFHLNCGLRNNCLNQFTTEYKSYCHRHVEDHITEKCAEDHVCMICYSTMGAYDKIQSVYAPCCKSEWFHKHCLMKLADSAGYFFKCPKCNDVDVFSVECMKRGIYIPQRDAAWETEANAFHDLMERPSRCDAIDCLSKFGRESDKPSNELIICETCGSSCIHKNCWRRDEPYYCCYQVDLKPLPDSDDEQRPNVDSIKAIEMEQIRKRKREQPIDHGTLIECTRKRRKTVLIQENSPRHPLIECTRQRRKTVLIQENSPRHPSAKGTQEPLIECTRKRRKTVLVLENSPRRPSVKGTPNRRSKKTNKTEKIKSKYPITKIRNGTFDEIFQFTPRIILCPLTLEQVESMCKKSVAPTDSNRSPVTSNVNNNTPLKDVNKSEFTIISPKKGKSAGGKSFKNYMITSFFKPFN